MGFFFSVYELPNAPEHAWSHQESNGSVRRIRRLSEALNSNQVVKQWM